TLGDEEEMRLLRTPLLERNGGAGGREADRERNGPPALSYGAQMARLVAAQRLWQAFVGQDLRIGRPLGNGAAGDGVPRLGHEIERLEKDRQRGDAPVAVGARRAIRTPDPDADRVTPVVADRPGVAESVGGSGLVGDVERAVEERARHR